MLRRVSQNRSSLTSENNNSYGVLHEFSSARHPGQACYTCFVLVVTGTRHPLSRLVSLDAVAAGAPPPDHFPPLHPRDETTNFFSSLPRL